MANLNNYFDFYLATRYSIEKIAICFYNHYLI